MKKITFILIILIGFLGSCTKNFEDFNTDKKRAVEVPGQFLFANAQKALADINSSTSVNINNWKLFAQYWTETTYTDESNYDVVNRNIGSTLFRLYYRDVLNDLKEARRLVELEAADGDAAIAAKANKLFLIDLVEVYAYHQLVDIFGDVPYTEALDIENISPVYDDGLTIYKDLLARAKAAADGLNAGAGSFGGDDLMMGGDVAMWKKFANTLIVKMAINLSDVDAATAKSYIEGAYAGGFGPGEACEFAYVAGANANPLYNDLVQSGRSDFVPANTIVDLMNNKFDPRVVSYFSGKTFVYDRDENKEIIDTELEGSGNAVLIYTLSDGTDSLAFVTLPFTALAADSSNIFKYNIGGVYGESNAFSQFSHINDRIQAPDYPYVMMDYTELAFYLAEAAARGMSVGGDAATWYENAVRASMAYWQVADADADAYLARADVAYATAPGDWKQKIGTQAYIAFYVRGLEGWTSYRRLDAPALNLPPAPAESADGAVPRRHTYAINEQTLNGDNYNAAASKIGGDKLSTRLFWDKQ